MAITINGTGSITGLTAGGLPDGSVVAADLASSLDLTGKTVTLPSGTGGKILNVAEVQITSTTTHNSNGSHTRFAAMDSTYTTQQTGSKILVIFNFMLSSSNSGGDANPKLFRKIGAGSASEIYANPSPVGSSTTGWIGVFRGDSVGAGGIRPTFSILDNPGHTAGDVLTYEHHWRTESVNNIRLNHGGQTGDARHATGISTVLFLEVAA
jgi:hypothetical protein